MLRKPKIDLTGDVFGRWTVLEPTSKRGYWKCRCICGIEKDVQGYPLRSGRSKSCGCIKKKYPKTADRRYLYSQYKFQAKYRKIHFDIERKYFFQLIRGNCYFCGMPPNNVYTNTRDGKVTKYNGVDRLDPTRGYVVGNLVSSCRLCNRMKGTMTEEQFESWVKNVYEHSKLSNVAASMTYCSNTELSDLVANE